MTVSSTEGAESAEVPTQDATPAESSAADPSEGVVSLSERIESALNPEQEASPAPQEPGSKEPDSASTEDDTSFSEEELKHLSEKTQHRFRKLVELQKTAEGRATEIQQELEAVKPKVEQMDKLSGYMREHGIQEQHLDNALGLTAMINRGDPAAIPVLENLLGHLRQVTGDVLPPELQKRVDLGYLTEDDAKNLHKANLRANRVEEQSKQERERGEADRRHKDAETVTRTAAETADTWNAEQVKSDPEWNLKRDRVTEKMELEVHRRLRDQGPEGFPRTPQAVRELLDKAKADVEKELKLFRPAPKAINPSPTGGSASPRSVAKPASVMDAVNMALETSE